MKTVSLGDVCEVIMGQAPPGSSYNSSGEGVPLLAGAGDFGTEHPKPKRFTNRPGRLSQRGDVLLCVRATIGDRNWSDRAYCVGRGVAALRPRSRELDPGYLWHWLASAKPALERRARGSTFKQVTRDAVESLRVPLLPLAEQQRIAAVLDKADAVRRKRRGSLELLDEFLRSAFLEMFGDPVTNEKGWELHRLADIALVDRGKFSPRPRNDPQYYEGPYPFIQTGDITGSAGRLRDWTQTLNNKGTTVSRGFPKETIAMTIAANIGDTAIVDFDFYCPDSVVGITPRNDAATPEFLETCLRFLKPGLTARAPMTAQRNINLQVLKPLRIPVPPLPLQVRFQAIRRRVEALSDRIEEASGDFGTLFDSLAQRAFGESERG